MLDPNNTRIGVNRNDDGEFTPDDQVVRPTQQSSKPTKDFKKILGKNRHDQSEEDALKAGGPKKAPKKSFKQELDNEADTFVGTQKGAEEQTVADNPSVSLFDLSAKSTQTVSKEEKKPLGEGAPLVKSSENRPKAESPAHMFANMSTKETSKPRAEPKIEPENMALEAPKTPEKAKETKFTTRYTQEQPDLSYVNPLAAASLAVPIVNNAERPSIQPAARISPMLSELVEHIVKTMYTVETKGQTDTVITLQYPPLLKDAQVVISAFDSARGQFNIRFENLTSQAQQVLSLEANKKSLIEALHDKGYGVQIFTATTQIENPLPLDDRNFQRDQGGREDAQERERRRRNNEETT